MVRYNFPFFKKNNKIKSLPKRITVNIYPLTETKSSSEIQS